jgi:hypothetical protein
MTSPLSSVWTVPGLVDTWISCPNYSGDQGMGSTRRSLLCLTGVTCIAKALRHHARHPDQAIACLLTC